MKSFTRKGAVIAVTVAAAIAMAGCSSSSSGGTTTGSSSDIKITFVTANTGDPYFQALTCGAKAQAAKQGVSFSTQGATSYSAPLQVPVLQSVAASKPSAIIIAPTDSSALQAPLNQAHQAGIPFVLVDSTIKDPSIAASSISSNNVLGGKTAFQAIQKLDPNGGKVLVVGVQPGVSTDDQRIEGFKAAISGDSSFDYLGAQYAQNDAAKGASIVNAALQKDPDISAIFATNEIAAEGAATGLRQANKQSSVKIVGFDALPGQIADLNQGTVQALVAQQPALMGKNAIEQAVKAIKNQPTTKSLHTKFTILTKANVNTAAGKAAVYSDHC